MKPPRDFWEQVRKTNIAKSRIKGGGGKTERRTVVLSVPDKLFQCSIQNSTQFLLKVSHITVERDCKREAVFVSGYSHLEGQLILALVSIWEGSCLLKTLISAKRRKMRLWGKDGLEEVMT